MYAEAEATDETTSPNKEYNAELTKYASKENVIILTFIDSSFLDMTWNFYETSIVKFNIENYLFIASDNQACEKLYAKHINCYVYMTDRNANKTSVYGTKQFIQKMHIRTYFILDALILGFTILHTDVDVVFFRNQLEDLYSSEFRNLACLSDDGFCNAGFIYLKSSEFTIDIYIRMKHTAMKIEIPDQTALNNELKAAVIKNNTTFSNFSQIQILDDKKYQNGRKYFLRGHRFYHDSATCPQCIVVHNNWMISKEAKRFRFREVLLWSYDENGYYSNLTTKYLMYSNVHVPYNRRVTINSSNIELDALKTALYLGHVLNRVVILPRFHVTNNGEERTLNNWIKIACLDYHFYEKYRENAFLLHPKVPPAIKKDQTSTFWIKTEESMTILGYLPQNVTSLTISSNKKISAQIIEHWFGGQRSAVLNLHSLYGIYNTNYMPSTNDTETLFLKLENAFQMSDYLQYRNKTRSCEIPR